MSEATEAVDESYATIKTEFVYNATNSEKIMKVVSQMVVFLILLNICLLNFLPPNLVAKKHKFGSQFYQAWLTTTNPRI